MAAPVWILSVDLQAKTATFQTGMSDAARSARGAFEEIGGGAEGMGRRMGRGTMEARHSIMMLGEEFGFHIPRALASFIASLGPVGAALEAAFPFIAVALGATLLIEHLAKLHEAGEKLTTDQINFGTVANGVFNSLDEKLIQAQIRADELRNDHLGALRLQLELIDKQSMAELVHEFETLDKAALTVMKDLEGHWYTFGKGSDGAKHALDDFKSHYDNLLSKGTKDGDTDAHNLLAGTLKTAQDVLKAQQTIKANRDAGGGQTDDSFTAEQTLRKHQTSLTVTEKEVEAQQELVDTLQRQVGVEERLNDLKGKQGNNLKTAEGNEEAARRAAAARQAAESMARMGEMSLTADRQRADAELTIKRATLEERLTSELEFAGRERDVKQAANAAEVAALDKAGKDYHNQLKALREKALEINQEYDTKVAELTAKSSVDVNARSLRDLEQNERAKIEATSQGSAERLAAIDAALKEEEALHLQDTAFYRELLNSRVQTARQAADLEARLKQDAAREEADNDQKMGELAVAAEKQRVALEDSARRVTVQQRIAEEIRFADELYNLKQKALEKEIAGLDKSGKDYQNKLKQLQDKEKQSTQQHENELTAIKEKAEIERNQRSIAALSQFEDTTARGLMQSILGHQTWSRMLINLTDQVASAALESRIREMVALDFGKEKEAAAAARKFFLAGAKLPFPVNLVAAPVLAAGAFAAVMAFEGGTDRVPGVGRGDVVPSMLSPGEGIVPGGVMDGLRNVARSGGFEQRAPTVVNFRPTYHVQTIDGDGWGKALEKHADQTQRHFETALRRMNR